VRDGIAGATPTRFRPHRADGTEVDATFAIERVGEALTIVVESRGGTRGSPAERNTEYAEGLEQLLERLAALGARITPIGHFRHRNMKTRELWTTPPSAGLVQYPSVAKLNPLRNPAQSQSAWSLCDREPLPGT